MITIEFKTLYDSKWHVVERGDEDDMTVADLKQSILKLRGISPDNYKVDVFAMNGFPVLGNGSVKELQINNDGDDGCADNDASDAANESSDADLKRKPKKPQEEEEEEEEWDLMDEDHNHHPKTNNNKIKFHLRLWANFRPYVKKEEGDDEEEDFKFSGGNFASCYRRNMWPSPPVAQSDQGMDLFLCSLYCLVSHWKVEKENYQRLVSKLGEVSIPAAAAMTALFHMRKLTIGQRSVLINTFHKIFNSIAPKDDDTATTTTTTTANSLFEKSRVLFAFLIGNIKDENAPVSSLPYHIKHIKLFCDLSNEKLKNPVRVVPTNQVVEMEQLKLHTPGGSKFIPGNGFDEINLETDVVVEPIVQAVINCIGEYSSDQIDIIVENNQHDNAKRPRTAAAAAASSSSSSSTAATITTSLFAKPSDRDVIRWVKDCIAVQVVEPLSLAQCTLPVITMNSEGKYVVATTRTKSVALSFTVFSPVTGDNTDIDVQVASKSLKEKGITVGNEVSGAVKKRNIDEVVVVCLDVSNSMGDKGFLDVTSAAMQARDAKPSFPTWQPLIKTEKTTALLIERLKAMHPSHRDAVLKAMQRERYQSKFFSGVSNIDFDQVASALGKPDEDEKKKMKKKSELVAVKFTAYSQPVVFYKDQPVGDLFLCYLARSMDEDFEFYVGIQEIGDGYVSGKCLSHCMSQPISSLELYKTVKSKDDDDDDDEVDFSVELKMYGSHKTKVRPTHPKDERICEKWEPNAQVFFRLAGPCVNLNVNLDKDTIEAVKRSIEDRSNAKLMSSQMRLTYAGKIMDDDKTLGYYGVPSEGTVHVNPKFNVDSDVDETMSRLDITKQLFYAFVNRTEAYNLSHAIGLVTFSSDIKVLCEVTPYWEDFRQKIETVTTNGETRTWDAIIECCSVLHKYKDKEPLSSNARLRVVLLTDGKECGSKKGSVDAANALSAAGITLDVISISKHSPQVELQRLAKVVTQGYCFDPKDLQSALQICEFETMLTLSARPSQGSKKKVWSPFELAKTTPSLETSVPEGKRHEMLDEKGIADLEHVQQKQQDKKQADETDKRILREIGQFMKDPHPNVKIFPCESNIRVWHAILRGASDTAYQGGVWRLIVEFPREYPDAHPNVRFISPFVHCNVNTYGRICHSILDRDWTPDWNMTMVFQCIYGLMLYMEVADPLDSVLAEEFYKDRPAFEARVRSNVKSQKHTFESLEHEITKTAEM